jgi:hypothetical protein
MHSEIQVVGWESAQISAKALTDNGYDVLIKTDGHMLPEGERSYMIEFVHPEYTGAYFEIVYEDMSGLRTWEEIKEEQTESLDSVLEGLDHLDAEKVDKPKAVKKKAKK